MTIFCNLIFNFVVDYGRNMSEREPVPFDVLRIQNLRDKGLMPKPERFLPPTPVEIIPLETHSENLIPFETVVFEADLENPLMGHEGRGVPTTPDDLLSGD